MKTIAMGMLLVLLIGCAAAPSASSPEVAFVVPAASATPAVPPVVETAPEVAPATPSTPMSSCGLVATISQHGDGGYTLTLQNKGKETLRLVAAGDGSEAGMRTPSLAWTGTSGGKPATPLPGNRCGMMNKVEKSEIFQLAPGATHTITEWINGPRFAKGTYAVRVRYTNDPTKLAGSSHASDEVMGLLTATSACEVTSAPLTIQVP